MGFGEALVEGALQGGTFGLSNLLGITGKDGLIHDNDDPDDQAIKVDSTGLTFLQIQPRRHLSWSEVSEIVDQNGDGTLYRFELRGGLIVFTGWVDGDVAQYSCLARCEDKDLADLNSDDLSRENLKMLKRARYAIDWMTEFACELRGSNHLQINEAYLLNRIMVGYENLCAFKTSGRDIVSGQFWNLVSDESCSEYLSLIRNQLRNVEFDDTDFVKNTIAFSVYYSRGMPPWEFGKGIEHQRVMYEAMRNARSWGCDVENLAVKFLSSSECDDMPLGDRIWARYRKIIVCNGEKTDVQAVGRGETIPGVFVIDAHDICDYNDVVQFENRLQFQPGHPLNGYTYVQHPFNTNVYYEVNSFHDSMLERKQNELLRVLESLGAYSAKVEISHECHETSSTESEFHLDGNGSNGMISGSGSTNTTTSRSKEVLSSQHATKDWQFNPPEKPELPQDLLFYPTEETWQQLATSVLRGGLKHAVVDLEYKTEYGITEKYLKEVSVSVKAMIPSYEMNLKTNFASNLHRLITTRWHYEVVFEDANGKRAGSAPSSVLDDDGGTSNKVEDLFLKRARRYAQSDAHIDAEQRSDLEKFAQKYGIDDLRMEELIEEAFV